MNDVNKTKNLVKKANYQRKEKHKSYRQSQEIICYYKQQQQQQQQQQPQKQQQQ